MPEVVVNNKLTVTTLKPHDNDACDSFRSELLMDVDLEAPDQKTVTTFLNNSDAGSPMAVRVQPSDFDDKSRRSSTSIKGSHSKLSATLNFINSIVGAGLIGLPFAMEQSGLFAGLFLLLLCAVLTSFSVRLLISLGNATCQDGYEGLSFVLLGSVGKFITSLTMFLLAMGAMIAYQVIIADTVPVVLEMWTGWEVLGIRQLTLCISSILVCFPLSSLTDIGKLSATSGLSVAAAVAIVLIIVFHAPVQSSSDNLKTSGPWRDGALSITHRRITEGFADISFAFVCQHSSFLVANSLSNRSEWSKVSHISIGTALLMSVVIGTSGYVAFVRCTRPDVLNNFPKEDATANVARMLLGLTMFLTYPMELFVARHSINSILFSSPMTLGRHWCITTVLFTITLLAGLVLRADDLSIVLSISGGVCSSVLGFVLPGLFFFLHQRRVSDPKSTFCSICFQSAAIAPMVLLLIGIASFASSLYFSGKDIIKGGFRVESWCPDTGIK